jgi:hypothetical protein
VWLQTARKTQQRGRMSGFYKTNRVSFASFLRYAGISHLSTLKLSDKVVQFQFDDPAQCKQLEYEFLSGCAVANALELLEADRDLKRTIKFASENDGRWDAAPEGSA